MTRRTLVGRLSRQDVGYLRRETATQPLHFVLLGEVAPRGDGTSISVSDVRAHVGERIDRLPELRRAVAPAPLGIGPPVWLRTTFDAERQIRDWTLPGRDRTALLDGLALLATERLDTANPPWSLRVGPVLENGHTAIALMVHHALMDGGLLAGVLLDLFGDVDQSGAAPAEATVSASRLLGAAVTEAVRHRLTLRRHSTAPPSAPQVRPGTLAGPVGPGRTVASVDVSLSRLRALSRNVGATINDLLLFAVAHGLHVLLAQRGHTVIDDELLAMVPRSVRTGGEQRAVGNHTWSMLVGLPVAPAHPLRRLGSIQASMTAAKSASGPAGTGGFAFDISLSNVRLGGSHTVAGAPIVAYHGAAPLQGYNRLVAVGMSYGDRFNVSFTADAAAFADIDVLARGTIEGFQVIHDTAAGVHRSRA